MNGKGRVLLAFSGSPLCKKIPVESKKKTEYTGRVYNEVTDCFMSDGLGNGLENR